MDAGQSLSLGAVAAAVAAAVAGVASRTVTVPD